MPVLLSDRDIRAEIEGGRVVLDPWDPTMVQPSSIDVRLDKYFRLFDNHKYPYIDPAEDQPDLTRLVEVAPTSRSILHPGEFVLGSTLRGRDAARRPRRAASRASRSSAGSACSPTPRPASSTRGSPAT